MQKILIYADTAKEQIRVRNLAVLGGYAVEILEASAAGAQTAEPGRSAALKIAGERLFEKYGKTWRPLGWAEDSLILFHLDRLSFPCRGQQITLRGLCDEALLNSLAVDLAQILAGFPKPSPAGEDFPVPVALVENHLGVPALAAWTGTWAENRLWLQDFDDDVLLMKLVDKIPKVGPIGVIGLDPFRPSLRLPPQNLDRLRALGRWLVVAAGTQWDYCADIGLEEVEKTEIWVVQKEFPHLLALSSAAVSALPDAVVVVGDGSIRTREIELVLPSGLPIIEIPAGPSPAVRIKQSSGLSCKIGRHRQKGLKKIIEIAQANTNREFDLKAQASEEASGGTAGEKALRHPETANRLGENLGRENLEVTGREQTDEVA